MFFHSYYKQETIVAVENSSQQDDMNLVLWGIMGSEKHLQWMSFIKQYCLYQVPPVKYVSKRNTCYWYAPMKVMHHLEKQFSQKKNILNSLRIWHASQQLTLRTALHAPLNRRSYYLIQPLTVLHKWNTFVTNRIQDAIMQYNIILWVSTL
jgi:hypothetical protein